jgi:hypothetical protein
MQPFFTQNIFQNILRSEKKLSSEGLLSNIIPFAGSGLLGYAMKLAPLISSIICVTIDDRA